MRELDLSLSDGRTLHAYDTRADAADHQLVIVWHHGTPNIGLPPEPLFAATDRLGIGWVSYDRPGYGGSTALRGRTVGSAAADVASLADALAIDRFAVMGHSGGAMHALACAALLTDRVLGIVAVATLAPFDAVGLDWFEGMSPAGMGALRAAAAGRAAKESYEASVQEDDPGFVTADHVALAAEWSWFGKVVGPALKAGPGALIDDDLAYVAPWGFDPASIACPTLFLHGGEDVIAPSAHARWLADRVDSAELRLVPGEGHISILNHAASALEWLRDRAGGRWATR